MAPCRRQLTCGLRSEWMILGFCVCSQSRPEAMSMASLRPFLQEHSSLSQTVCRRGTFSADRLTQCCTTQAC